MLEERLRYVKVTNNGDKPFVDMYDGIPVTIDPRSSQNIRPEQAFHFFGFTEDAKREQMMLHTAKRRGWNTAEYLAVDAGGKTLMQQMFDQLVIEPVIFKLVEEAPAIDKPIPAEGSDDEGVESAPPPPKFQPVKPQARAAKSAPKRVARDDDE